MAHKTVLLSVMLNVINAECHYAEYHYAEYHYAEYHYAEYHYAEYHYAECHYAKYYYAECHYMLSVVAPFLQYSAFGKRSKGKLSALP